VNTGTLTGTGANYPSVSVVDANVIWVAGGSGGSPQLWLSTSGGLTFAIVNTPPSFELTCIYAISANECFVGDGGSAGAAGGNAKFFRTTNAGANWTLVNQTGGTSGFFADVVFSKVNSATGIAISKPPAGTGTAFYLLKTTDSGNNWTQDSPGAVSGSTVIWHCGIIYDATAYGFGITGGIFPQVRGTTDAGTTWNTFPVLIALGTLTSFAYSDISAIALASTSTVVARTTDQGTSWQTVDNGGALNLKWIYGSSTCYLMTASAVKKSTDNGASFTAMTVTGASGLRHFDFAYSGANVKGFAITSAGVIYKLSEPLTGILKISESVPHRFSLGQNYPNPFNPETKIRFDIPASGNVKMVLYDISGRELATLVNEELSPGSYEINFNAAGYSSGVYFYELVAGNYTATNKMMLIK
jgi:photosystem II stability/assembly factor-like uncharacterized protein